MGQSRQVSNITMIVPRKSQIGTACSLCYELLEAGCAIANPAAGFDNEFPSTSRSSVAKETRPARPATEIAFEC